MATKRPSFLKRQKELKRTARALEKREARKERKASKTNINDPVTLGTDDDGFPAENDALVPETED